MILKETLGLIVDSQKDSLSSMDSGIAREKIDDIDYDVPFAIVLSGIRRCGKSTLLRQLAKKVGKFYYFNFEDPRAVDFEIGDFQRLNNVFIEKIGDCKYYFFDEIQNVKNWELFVRQMLEKKKHFIITGSNASLLSKELGTKLTGRHLRYELFPFSFKEMLKFTGRKPSLASFEEYFKNGGFPEYLKFNRIDILQELLNDIVARDILVRYKLKNLKVLREMAVYLLTNTGKEFSYNSLKEAFKLGSTNTASSFVSYFEDSYLLFTVPKFDYSLKKQSVNAKKVYSIDNGFSIANSASFSSDFGRMLENIVYIHLRRKYKDIFYFREKSECDFIVRDKNKVIMVLQVCYKLNEDNKGREFDGIIEAMSKFNLKEGIILTYNQEDEHIVDGKKIRLMPVWKWLLG